MRKGIHPLLRTVRVVMRNGASFEIPTTMNRATPLILQSDPTTHPAWTGEKAGISMEDERMQRVMGRLGGFVATDAMEEDTVEQPQQPEADK